MCCTFWLWSSLEDESTNFSRLGAAASYKPAYLCSAMTHPHITLAALGSIPAGTNSGCCKSFFSLVCVSWIDINIHRGTLFTDTPVKFDSCRKQRTIPGRGPREAA